LYFIFPEKRPASIVCFAMTFDLSMLDMLLMCIGFVDQKRHPAAVAIRVLPRLAQTLALVRPDRLRYGESGEDQDCGEDQQHLVTHDVLQGESSCFFFP
jgi:hypothetical protein